MTESPMHLDGIVTTFAWDDAVENLYAMWRDEARMAGRVHAALGRRLRTRSLVAGALGVIAALAAAAVVLAPIVAPDAYATATKGMDPVMIRVAAASLAAIAALLATIRAIAWSGVRAERHRVAALRYRSLDRAMAAMLALPGDARSSSDEALAWARERLTRYERESPDVAGRTRTKLEGSFEPADARTVWASRRPAVDDARGFVAT